MPTSIRLEAQNTSLAVCVWAARWAAFTKLSSMEAARSPAVDRDSRIINDNDAPWLRRRRAGIRPLHKMVAFVRAPRAAFRATKWVP